MSATPQLRPLTRSLRLQCTPHTHHSSQPKSAPLKFVRAKSSKANTSAATKAEAALKANLRKGAPTEAEKETLPWADYLTIRKSKRRWETAMTIPLTIAGFAGGIAYFGEMELDPSKPIFNLDPMLVLGGATLGCAGLGYLVGPIVGSSCWRMTHRRSMKLIEAKDREFHKHIVKNRVDPTAQSATNPVPDFYGEKIGSLNDYRQWLRDQARYKRKAALPED